MEIDSDGDICGIPGKNKYRRERELKKYFKLLFRVLAAVFCVALPVRYNLPDKIYTSDRRQAEIGRVPEIKLIAKTGKFTPTEPTPGMTPNYLDLSR